MATQFDTAFLKIAVYNKVTDQQTATRCLQLLQQAQQSGHSVRAPDLLARTGVAPNVLERLSAMTVAAMKQQGLSPDEQPAAQPQQSAPSQTSTKIPAPSPATTQSQRQPAAQNRLDPVDPANVELREKIGSGPTGHLYLGRDKSSGKELALKVLTRKFAKSEKVLDLVRKTLNHAAAARLAHPNIGSLHCVFEKEKRNIAVFDRVSGECLDSMLEAKGSLSQSRVIKIGLQVATALHHAHQNRLCHGDIRPAKIMVDGEDVKLVDFGMAHATALIQGYSRSGVPFGHPCYLAPEIVQTKSRQPTPQSDLYALGIMLYELLMGERPFVGEDPRRVLQAHLKTPLPKPPETAGLHQKVALALFKLTAKDPKSRLPSAGHAIQMFRLLDELGLESSGEIESVTEADWQYQSEETAAPNDWSEENVQAAPGLEIGASWNPEEGEDDDRRPGVSGRMAGMNKPPKKFEGAGQDLTALAASLAQAADQGKTFTTLTKKEQDRRDSRGDIGNAGNRLKLVGAQVRERQTQLQLIFGVVVSLIVVVVLASTLMFSPREEIKRKPQLAHDKTAEIKKAADQVDRDAISQQLEQEKNQLVNKLLGDIESGIGVAVNNGDYDKALSLIRFFENPAGPEPKIIQRLKYFEEQAIKLGKKAFKELRETVKKAIETRKIEVMQATLNRVKTFSVLQQDKPMQDVMVSQLESAINEQKKWQAEQTADLKLEKWQRAYKNLRFIRPVFKKGNRIVALYDFAVPAELKDFELDKKAKIAHDPEKKEVVFVADDKPILLLFPIPPRQVNSLKIEFTPDVTSLKGGSEVSFVVGLDSFKRNKGVRMTSTGKAIVFKPALKDGKLVIKESVVKSGQLNGDPWKGRHTLELKVRRNSARISLDKRKTLSKAGELYTGLCGIYLRNVKVVMHRIKFDVVVEPEEVNRWLESKK